MKAVRFRFVEEHSGAFPTERLCQVMNVSPRGLRAGGKAVAIANTLIEAAKLNAVDPNA